MKFLEKFKKPVPIPIKLPDNGGSFLPPENLRDTIVLSTPESCLVKIALVKDVREGDYKQVITTLESMKKTEIDAETLIPWALNKGLGYEVEEITITTKFKEMKNLEGGVMLNEQQLASFRKMEFAELNDVNKFLETGKVSEDSKELIKLSSELAGKEWQLVNYKGALNQGMRAVIVIKKKIPEIVMIEETQTDQISPFLTAPATWDKLN